MADEGAREQMTGLNALGTAEYVGQRFGVDPGGNTGRGSIGQCLPTAEIARGQDVNSPDNFARGDRAGMSSTKNKDLRREARR